jgi:hypothetical protein
VQQAGGAVVACRVGSRSVLAALVTAVDVDLLVLCAIRHSIVPLLWLLQSCQSYHTPGDVLPFASLYSC